MDERIMDLQELILIEKIKLENRCARYQRLVALQALPKIIQKEIELIKRAGDNINVYNSEINHLKNLRITVKKYTK